MLPQVENPNSYGFSIGELVKLKSGGPDMVVSNPSTPNGNVECVFIRKSAEDMYVLVVPRQTLKHAAK